MTRHSVLPAIGAPLDRVDGRLKVTGAARYAAEFPVANAAHAVIITSSIAKGTVTSIDTAAALRTHGVLSVLTPFNAPRVDVPAPATGMRVPTVLQSTMVHYNGQPIGVLVADTFEHAM